MWVFHHKVKGCRTAVPLFHKLGMQGMSLQAYKRTGQQDHYKGILIFTQQAVCTQQTEHSNNKAAAACYYLMRLTTLKPYQGKTPYQQQAWS